MHRGMSTTKSHTRGLFLSLLESFAGSLQSFDLEASLLDADFCFDGTTVPDMFAVSDPFGDDGDVAFAYDFCDVASLGDYSGNLPSLISSSQGIDSSASIATRTGGFLGKFPTGARSRHSSSASRICSRGRAPSLAATFPQKPHHSGPTPQMCGLHKPCQDSGVLKSAPIELAVTTLCWPAREFPSFELTRQQRVQRYREKRKRRTFAKTIRYEARRAYAEVRPRIKGRFATKEEAAAIRATRIKGTVFKD